MHLPQYSTAQIREGASEVPFSKGNREMCVWVPYHQGRHLEELRALVAQATKIANISDSRVPKIMCACTQGRTHTGVKLPLHTMWEDCQVPCMGVEYTGFLWAADLSHFSRGEAFINLHMRSGCYIFSFSSRPSSAQKLCRNMRFSFVPLPSSCPPK